MTSLRQPSFSGGILSPQVQGRSDVAKYATGLAILRNFMVTKWGGVENRAGTEFIGACAHTSGGPGFYNPVRLAPFVFSQEISYVLELGVYDGTNQGYIRFYTQGAPVGPGTPWGWSSGITYGIGDLVSSSGVNYWSKGTSLNLAPASYPAAWYAMPAGLLELPAPWINTDILPLISYTQQNSLMTLVAQDFYPQVLVRYSDTHWTLAPIDVSGAGAWPVGIRSTAGVGGAIRYNYTVTAVSLSTGTESIQGFTAPRACTVSDIFPQVSVHLVAHKWNTGDTVTLTGFTLPLGTLFLNNTTWKITVTGADDFLLDGAAGPPGGPSPVTGNVVANEFGLDCGTPTSTAPNVITWTAITGTNRYNVYRLYNGVYGFVGSSPTPPFSDVNILPDIGNQPPVQIPLFQTANDYPGTVGTFQQRLLFGNTINQPQTMWMSRTGDDRAFTVGTPVLDSDAIQVVIAGKQVQTVQAFVDIGKLIVHCSAGEYLATGNQANTLTPQSIGMVQQGYAGTSDFPAPVPIGSTDLFVQARGTQIRDLQYEVLKNQYTGKDCTVYVPSLFDNQTILDMDWQQVPHSILWVVVSSGQLYGITYGKEQDIWGWHTHDTQGGVIENVVVIPEDNQDAVYLCVRRTLDNGLNWVRYIERMAARDFTDITTDAVFTDSTLASDNRIFVPGDPIAAVAIGEVSITAITGYTVTDTVTLFADHIPTDTVFAASDATNNNIATIKVVSAAINDAGVLVTTTTNLRFRILTYTDANTVIAQPLQDVPVAYQATAIFFGQANGKTFGIAKRHFSGLDHLEGMSVEGLGDGYVIPAATVTGGTITTQNYYVVAQIGLPITANLQTLDIENSQGETLLNKNKAVVELTALFYNSRGGWYGSPGGQLYEIKQRTTEPWNTPVYLQTGPYRIPVAAQWQKTGVILIRQSDALPMGIASLVVTGTVGN